MKSTAFLLSLAYLIFSHQLSAYSSISEYNSDTANNYSSIGCYSTNTAATNKDNTIYLEDQINNTSINVETNNETQALAKEASESGEIIEIMMAVGPLAYNGKIKLDDDGTGSSHGDKNHAPETSLKKNGQSLNADIDSYVVAPRWLLNQGVKAGDKANVTVYFYEYNQYVDGNGRLVTYPCNRYTRSVSSIVGDVGPATDDVGEISIKTARDLGLGIKERSNGLGPVPTDPSDQVNWDRDIYATVTYYPSGS